MKFYIASRLENAENVSLLAAILKAAGHTHTYDWTTHGSVRDKGAEIITQVAGRELRGVTSADMLIVLLPGGRGTHTELGIALGCGCRSIIICGEEEADFEPNGQTCAFYWHIGIKRLIGPLSESLAIILQTARIIDSEGN